MGALQNLGVPFNISVMAEASYFKFGTDLGFAKSNDKITAKDKSERNPCLGAPKNLGFPLIFMQWPKLSISNLVHSLGLPIRPIIKSQK